MNNNFLILLFLYVWSSSLYAQLNSTIIGDAIIQGNNCFTITPDLKSQKGGVWYDNPIDFEFDFTINYQNNFGNKDGDGADGMVLVFKRNPNPEIGGSGGDIGYSGISPSLAIEFDTYKNSRYGDPNYDHIGIMKHGLLDHNASTHLKGPVQASASERNIEDGDWHEIKIEWIAATTTLKVFFDCIERLSLVQDVKNTVFSDDNSVFFGFVGSTGNLTNINEVCFNSISFVDHLILKDETICENESIRLDATIPSGVNYAWHPTTGLNNPNIANPTFSPSATTVYTLSIEDVCGDIITNDLTITVNPLITPTFTAVPAICSGDTLAALPTTSDNGIDGTWSPALDNTATTTYTFTPRAGLCATTQRLTITVNPLITPTFPAVPAICSGDTLAALPTTSDNGIEGTWSPALDNTATTIYTFTPRAGLCATTQRLIITVNPLITPTFTEENDICHGDTLDALPTVSRNGIDGSWSPALDNTATTTYTFTPRAGLCATTQRLIITVNPLITPAFPAVPAICSGDTLDALPTTSDNGIDGTWSPALDNTATTTYTFTPRAGLCATTQRLTITVNPLITHTFPAVSAICSGATLAPLPTTSDNGIEGTWSPALNNTATTIYTFTPRAGLCATTQRLTITVNPLITPTFTAVPAICSGDTLAALPTTSDNGIEGTWSPALDNTATTTYTFTPIAGQGCIVNTEMRIDINPLITPTFPAVPAICSGDTLAALPTVSDNGIEGTWLPALDNTATTTYTFTPHAGLCATTQRLTITVNPLITPTFIAVPAICSGDTLAALPTISDNGIEGTWSPALNNTATTTYTFTPRAGLCATTQRLTITVNPLITPTFTAVPAICSGDTLAALPTTSDNGIDGSWSPALDNTATTIYTFTPRVGLCATTQRLIITVNPLITPTFPAVPAICSGATLDALPTISDNGIDGTWSPALNNTATTTYTFTPIAGQGCFVNTEMRIDVNPLITPTFPAVPAICSGDTLAALPTTSDNGIDGSWSPALDNTATTIYTFTPRVGLCATTQRLIITVNPLITPTFTEENDICHGDTLAALPTTSDNGITGTWLPALNNTATTTYTFTPIAGQGCFVNTEMRIDVNPLITPTFPAVPAICSGDTLAALPTTSDNGIDGTWSPALDNTATTIYTFTPRVGLCATTQRLTITVNPLITPTFPAVPAICSGDTLAALPTTSDNGIEGTWSPALDNTATTIYTFTPRAGLCATTQRLIITVNPLITPTFTEENDICHGDTLAALPTVSRNGIEGTWSPALDNTATTIYTFTPRAGLCATTQRLIITVNPLITPTFTEENDICHGDTLAALPTVSRNGIEGTWSPALDNTATTTYTFTPIAGQGCIVNTEMRIDVNPLITPTFPAVPAICSGATLAPLPTVSNNGIEGTWSPALNNTATTTYTFTPIAGQGCIVNTEMRIDVNPLITPTFITVPAICSGDTLDALPTISDNGIEGTWSPALNNTATTTYTFTPIAGQGCIVNTEMRIDVNPLITPTFIAVPAICSGDTLDALPTTSDNGIDGSWSPALDNTATTTYTFTPIAGQGCFVNTEMRIDVNPLITPTFPAVPAICSGDTLAALPTVSDNGIDGTWSPALNNTATTTYTFTPRVGLCATTQRLTITVNPLITPTFPAVPAICSGDTLAPLPTISDNGIEGTWLPALNNIATTTYTFTPRVGLCATTQRLTITVNPLITPTFPAVPAICSGDTLAPLPTISDNGIEGTWLPALNNIATTTYTFTPRAGLCATTQRLTITVNPLITPTFPAVPAICSGDTLATLPTTSDNGIEGTWSPALNNTATTTYTFTPRAGLCATTQRLTITVNPLITPTFTAVPAICSGDTLAALPTTSNNGIEGTWSPALDNTATTTYTFTPIAGQGCFVNTEMRIDINPLITPTFTAVPAICSGDTLAALPTTSDNGIEGTWSPALDNTATTTYTFTPLAGLCAIDTALEIVVFPINNLEISINFLSLSFHSNQAVEVKTEGGDGFYEYQLNGGMWVNENVFTNLLGCDVFHINVRQLNTCSTVATDSFRVLNYPKFFTPNGDANNPTWNIECLRDQPSAVIYIFNRYGKLVTKISPSGPGWDGYYDGELMPTDDYWFKVTYLDNVGVQKLFKSHFTLKR